MDGLNGRIGTVLRWLVLAMVLVGAYNALARYASRWIGVPLASTALYELQWYLFSVIFLLGAAYGLLKDAHVRVDVVFERLPDRWRAGVDLVGTLLFLLPFSAVMLLVAWPPVRNSWRIREVSPDPGGLARYPIKALILVSFGLLFLQGISRLVKAAGALRRGEAYRPGDEAGTLEAGLEGGEPLRRGRAEDPARARGEGDARRGDAPGGDAGGGAAGPDGGAHEEGPR